MFVVRAVSHIFNLISNSIAMGYNIIITTGSVDIYYQESSMSLMRIQIDKPESICAHLCCLACSFCTFLADGMYSYNESGARNH